MVEVLGTRSKRPCDKDQFRKFQEKLIQYVMQNINDPQDIAPIPKDTKDPWTSNNGSNPNKLADKGKEDPME